MSSWKYPALYKSPQLRKSLRESRDGLHVGGLRNRVNLFPDGCHVYGNILIGLALGFALGIQEWPCGAWLMAIMHCINDQPFTQHCIGSQCRVYSGRQKVIDHEEVPEYYRVYYIVCLYVSV